MKAALTAKRAAAAFLSGGPETYRLTWPVAAVVLAYGASLLLFSLGGATRSLTYHEVIFTQPAKEMLASGNWVLPTTAGVPNTHKPPGNHWAIAVVMWLTGSQAEGIVRIPSVLAGLATALIVSALAARWFGTRVALVTGLVQLTTYYVLQLARLAEADMPLTMAVTGAMGAFAVANVDSPRGRSEARCWPWVFYACLSLSYLFKGWIGAAFVLSGCGAFVLVQREWRGLRFLLNPLGVAGFLLSTLGWFAAAYSQYPPILADQVMHHMGRFQGEMGGNKDPFFYLYSTLLITLPWAPFIMLGVVHGLRSGLHTLPWWRFTACWVIPGLILLNLSNFKSKHYAAPLMPPLAVVAALSLLAWLRSSPHASHRFHVLLAVAGVVGCAAAGAAISAFLPRSPDEKQVLVALCAVAAVGMVVVACCRLRHWSGGVLTATFATAWIVAAATFSLIMPHHDSYRSQAELSARVNRSVPADSLLYLVELPANGENQIIYYLHQQFRRYDQVENFDQAVPRHYGELFVLAPAALREHLARHGHVEPLDVAAIRRKQPPCEQLTLYKLTSRLPLARALDDPMR